MPPVQRSGSHDLECDEVTAWALRAQAGDPVAEAAFVRATQADVWRLCAGLVDTGVADDLAQEAYLRAFRALPAFEARSSARTWLLGIARRTCADHLRVVVRRRRLEQRLAAEAMVSTPPTQPSDGHGPAELIASLPAERRSAFVLTQLLGLSYAEAADAEGVPVGTIRSRVARARTDLAADVIRAMAA